MWSEVVTLFRAYMGKGLIVGWFLLSVAYLFLREKRKPVRILFLYVPVLLLLLYFNPLFSKLVYGLAGDEIYYRILWLLPMTVVIAYASVQLYSSVKGRLRIGLAALLSVLIMISGSYIYQNPFFHRAENLYHIPASVVDICDAIRVEGREVMAVFPVELLQYVRQYSPVVCMPYGREATVDRWGYNYELYDVMEAAVVEAERLAGLAREACCHYIILPQEQEMEGSLLDYGYEVFGQMHGYVIYLDPGVNRGLIPE